MRLRLLLSSTALSLVLSLSACSGVPDKDKAANEQAATTTSGNSAAAPFTGPASAQKSEPEKKGLFSSLVPTTITVPAGTAVSVRLQNAVSSATSNPGDSFEATLDEPLVVKGETVAPRGASVTGKVVEAKSSGHLHDSGYIRLTLTAINVGGKTVPVQTSSIFAKGANHNKRNAALIGGGTGAGALIGGLAGGGKGALIGGLVGAGAGTGGAYATGKKDVAFGAERKLSFRLTQPLTTKS